MDGFANDKPLNTQKMDNNADGRVEMDEFIRCCLEVKLMSINRFLIHLGALETSN